MASSETNPQLKYEVFINFRGVDTRYGFTSHLVDALHREKIEYFVDEEGLEGGDEIKPSILEAIKESMISVVIFSKGYASSAWCLDELVEILKCKECGQKVVPIFYHVAPTDVGNQTGPFRDALAELEECSSKNERKEKRWIDNQRKWRADLAEAAKISGFCAKDFKTESDLVKEIVKCVLKILNLTATSNNSGLKIIGRESSITEILSLLQIGSKEHMRIVGIWGMGGIGKSAIARVIYDSVKSKFDNPCFIQEVREKSDKKELASVQEHLLSEMVKYPNPDIGSPHTRKMLRRRKHLIVLDDVTTVDQVEFLIGRIIEYLGPESRVIITARDRHVLTSFKVHPITVSIYEVKRLSDSNALKLFLWHAFQSNDLSSSYGSLPNRVVDYAKGVPLALEKLGKYLFGRTIKAWENAISKLQRTPHQAIHEQLKISYAGLDNNQKKIFLDIACFLKWEARNIATRFWDACGFETEIGISELIDKCLITILDGKIAMNDLLQLTGWEIVREESNHNLSRYTRLWHYDDIIKYLGNNMGRGAIEGISLDVSKIKKKRRIDLKPNVFREMHNMRYLKLHRSDSQEKDINDVISPQGIESGFNDLKYLCWHGFPLKSLELFQTVNLVALYMPHSNVEKLWTTDDQFDNLEYINLSHSKHLVEILNFSLFPKLKSLILEGCIKLNKICSSIEHLKELVELNLGHCISLQSLPELPKSLNSIDAYGCTALKVTSVISIVCSTKTSVTGNFTNCFELDQKELEDTIKGILQKIAHMTMRSCPTYGCICLPINEIPFQQWFDLKSTGSSLTVDSASVWLHKEFVTFALYAIVQFQNYQNKGQGLVVGYDCKIGEDLFYQGTLSRWDHGSGPPNVHSDHVFLGYNGYKFSHDANKYSSSDKMTIQFYIKDLEGNDISNCNVKKCGFQLLHPEKTENPTEVKLDPEEKEEPQCTTIVSPMFEDESCSRKRKLNNDADRWTDSYHRSPSATIFNACPTTPSTSEEPLNTDM